MTKPRNHCFSGHHFLDEVVLDPKITTILTLPCNPTLSWEDLRREPTAGFPSEGMTITIGVIWAKLYWFAKLWAGNAFSVEGLQGPHSAGGAPRARLPPGASPRDSRPLRQAVWRRRTTPPCPPCGRMWRTAARVFSANASVSDGIGNRGIVSLLPLASCGT